MTRDYYTFWANFPLLEPPWIRRGGEGVSKHTPGPWRIDEWGDIVAGLRDIAETAHIWNDGGDDTLPEMRRANARLIAAAPDLLAACKALLDAIEGDSIAYWHPIWDDVRAAIAAAEDTP